MKAKFLIAGALWAGATIASAAPADALFYAYYTTGSYAYCGYKIDTYPYSACGITFNYRQWIRTAARPCSQGTCDGADSKVNVEAVYSFGRKPVFLYTDCSGPMDVFGLSTCAC